MNNQHPSTERNTGTSTRKRLQVAFVLNFIFTIIGLIGGYLTNSVAIFSDAIHDMGDTVAIGSALWLEKLSLRGRDDRFSYGYKRFSTLGALITSLILLAGSVVILYEAIPRLFAPQEVKAMGMMWMSILGIIFNGLAVLRLKGGNKSLNNRAVMLHLIEDVMGWVAVLVGSIIIHHTGLYWIDPFLSLLVAGFILYNVFKNLRGIMLVFLQSNPSNFEADGLQQELINIEGVSGVHDIHCWSMDGVYHILSLHLVVKEQTARQDLVIIRGKASTIIRQFGIDHSTIAIEFENETCDQCQ